MTNLKPFDIVTTAKGSVAFIKEVSINRCQTPPMVSYSIDFLIGGKEEHVAWYDKEDLTYHSNMAVKIAESMCNVHGRSDEDAEEILTGAKR